MFFEVASYTDKGSVRQSNQDAYLVKTADTILGRLAFAVICDGMGGMECGEVASSAVIRGFDRWFREKFPSLLENWDEETLLDQWNETLLECDDRIRAYGDRGRLNLGTTVTALLTLEKRYYLFHVGDTRAYSLYPERAQQLTVDQTLAERERRAGHITDQEYQTDERRSVLLQCVGCGKQRAVPDCLSGSCGEGSTFFLCSDGFYHMLSGQELRELALVGKQGKEAAEGLLEKLCAKCRGRGESDNITGIWLAQYASTCPPTIRMNNLEGQMGFQVLSDRVVTHSDVIL